MQDMVHGGWKKIGLLQAWEPDMQLKAMRKNLEFKLLDPQTIRYAREKAHLFSDTSDYDSNELFDEFQDEEPSEKPYQDGEEETNHEHEGDSTEEQFDLNVDPHQKGMQEQEGMQDNMYSRHSNGEFSQPPMCSASIDATPLQLLYHGGVPSVASIFPHLEQCSLGCRSNLHCKLMHRQRFHNRPSSTFQVPYQSRELELLEGCLLF